MENWYKNTYEFDIVKKFSRTLDLENKTDGTIYIYISDRKGLATKPDGYYFADGVTFILSAKSPSKNFKDNQLKDYMNLEQNENFVGFNYSGNKFECYVNGKLIESEVEPKNYKYYLEKYFKDAKIKTNEEIVSNVAKKLANLFRDSKINKQMNVPFIGAIMLCLKFNKEEKHFIGKNTSQTLQLIKENIDDIISDTPLTKKQKKEFLKTILGDSTLQKADYTDILNIISEISKVYNFINVSDKKGHDTMNNFLKIFRKWNSVNAKEKGEVFTPDHVAKLMYKLIDCNINDVILDPTCGSGTFLVNALALMLEEVKNDEDKKKDIRENKLIGVEFDDFNATLAGINMMLHGDGSTNIYSEDCFKKIPKLKNCYNKVLMNPPFSQNIKELEFVKLVLDNSIEGSLIATILPKTCANKNEQIEIKKKIFRDHSLVKTVILPDDLFYPTLVKTCIMVFKSYSKNNSNRVEQYDYSNDGYKVKKHIGRIDIDNCEKTNVFWDTKPVVNSLSYDDDLLVNDEFNYSSLKRHDFILSKLNFYKSKIDSITSINNKELDYIVDKFGNISFNYLVSNINLNTKKWDHFYLKNIFKITKTKDSSKIEIDGNTPYVSRKAVNNGVEGYKNVGELLIEHNCLTIHSEWRHNFVCFYQDGSFCADGKIVKLENDNLDKNNGLFISTILSKIRTLNYRLETLYETKIPLPITDEGEPDWIWMGKYISNSL